MQEVQHHCFGSRPRRSPDSSTLLRTKGADLLGLHETTQYYNYHCKCFNNNYEGYYAIEDDEACSCNPKLLWQ